MKHICPHAWDIERATGPTSLGTCKLCGVRRKFANSLDAVENKRLLNPKFVNKRWRAESEIMLGTFNMGLE